jgi:hypothetical protein
MSANRFIIPLLLAAAGACSATAREFSPRPWNSYRTIMWTGDSAWKKPDKIPLFFQRLQEMGVNTAMVHGDGNLKPFVDNKFPYYVENMVNKGLCLKWSSNVRDWDAVITGWAKSGRPASAFVRDYCLDDPQWRTWGRKQMEDLVRKNMANAPLLYDIRDELSTTISANPFDYDFSPVALAAFRQWLQKQYASVERLNAQWETQFARWEDVTPFSTDQIKNRMSGGGALPRGNPDWQALAATKFNSDAAIKERTRWNFAPWADFRTFMDISLAAALDDFRQAAHRLDPNTPVGIEGTQMPHAFGGYDLWRLSQVLDWVEPYDICNAREIFGSFMPGKPFLTTVGEPDARAARRRLWHLLLEGDKGCIIWWSEDCIDWTKDDYPLTSRAKALGEVMREMTGPAARLVMQAKREFDPVYILYSQPSIQVAWLMESTVDGSTWQRRFSSFEASANRHARVRDGWLKAFQDRGFSPQFVSATQLATWQPPRGAALALPQSLALSDAEVAAIKKLQAGGTIILTNGSPGIFDEHGSLRTAAPFPTPGVNHEQACLLGGASPFSGKVEDHPKQRMQPGAPFGQWLAGLRLPAAPPIPLPPEKACRIYRYSISGGRLLALERAVSYHMSEDLKQAGGNEALEQPAEVSLTLPAGQHAYDLRTAAYLGSGKVTVRVDPWIPSLVVLLPQQGADVRRLVQ